MHIHVIGDSVSQGGGASGPQVALPHNVHFESHSRPWGWVAYLSILLASSSPNRATHIVNHAVGGQGPDFFWHCCTNITGFYHAILFECVRRGEDESWDRLLTRYKNAILVDYRNPAYTTMNKSKLEPGLKIVDATDIFIKHNKDGIHPTDEGHQLIAYRVHRLLISQDWSPVEAHQRPVLCLKAHEMVPAAGELNGFQLRRWRDFHGAVKTSWLAWHDGDNATFSLPYDTKKIFVNAYTRPNMSSFNTMVRTNSAFHSDAKKLHTTARKHWWLPAGRGLDKLMLVAQGHVPRGTITIVNRCAVTCELQITGLLMTLDVSGSAVEQPERGRYIMPTIDWRS